MPSKRHVTAESQKHPIKRRHPSNDHPYPKKLTRHSKIHSSIPQTHSADDLEASSILMALAKDTFKINQDNKTDELSNSFSAYGGLVTASYCGNSKQTDKHTVQKTRPEKHDHENKFTQEYFIDHYSRRSGSQNDTSEPQITHKSQRSTAKKRLESKSYKNESSRKHRSSAKSIRDTPTNNKHININNSDSEESIDDESSWNALQAFITDSTRGNNDSRRGSNTENKPLDSSDQSNDPRRLIQRSNSNNTPLVTREEADKLLQKIIRIRRNFFTDASKKGQSSESFDSLSKDNRPDQGKSSLDSTSSAKASKRPNSSLNRKSGSREVLLTPNASFSAEILKLGQKRLANNDFFSAERLNLHSGTQKYSTAQIILNDSRNNTSMNSTNHSAPNPQLIGEACSGESSCSECCSYEEIASCPDCQAAHLASINTIPNEHIFPLLENNIVISSQLQQMIIKNRQVELIKRAQQHVELQRKFPQVKPIMTFVQTTGKPNQSNQPNQQHPQTLLPHIHQGHNHGHLSTTTLTNSQKNDKQTSTNRPNSQPDSPCVDNMNKRSGEQTDTLRETAQAKNHQDNQNDGLIKQSHNQQNTQPLSTAVQLKHNHSLRTNSQKTIRHQPLNFLQPNQQYDFLGIQPIGLVNQSGSNSLANRQGISVDKQKSPQNSNRQQQKEQEYRFRQGQNINQQQQQQQQHLNQAIDIHQQYYQYADQPQDTEQLLIACIADRIASMAQNGAPGIMRPLGINEQQALFQPQKCLALSDGPIYLRRPRPLPVGPPSTTLDSNSSGDNELPGPSFLPRSLENSGKSSTAETRITKPPSPLSHPTVVPNSNSVRTPTVGQEMQVGTFYKQGSLNQFTGSKAVRTSFDLESSTMKASQES
ncbi:hypothetical protein CLU79DRAFT_834136 [Phycomyces nitens]|nr:hypothetical protein CLU79DRAFT_834136 [Phycomyces nitens]